jgi:glucans biosynthesis protein
MMPSFAADRRELLFALAAIGFSGGAMAAPVKASSFRPEQVDALARAMAGRAFVAPDVKLPPALSTLSYDDYRDIRFDRRHALWTGKGRIIAEPMLRGWLAKDKVELFEVAGVEANPYPFDPARFDFAKRGLKGPADPAVGFSGIRFLGPINAAGRLDEIGVFQGASYFRSLGRNQLYGISARGLALGTGGPQEEFPLFRTFWLEQPDGAGEAIRVHALLDSPSIAGAYHFTIRAGETTVFDVEARLYPRTLVGAPGVAPMSSMFLFGPGSARRFDDFRRAVHDSDGLEMWTGKGERLWRPLANPTSLAVSAFADENPKGFGLIQRARSFAAYDDLEARYDLRPSLWVEPLAGWGPGSVQLIEIPAADETGDNIAAFWRPRDPWRPGREVRLRYRLHWGPGSTAPRDVARVMATRAGATVIGIRRDNRRHFAIDFEASEALANLDPVRAVAVTSAGSLSEVRLQALPGAEPEGGRVRASFDLDPPASGPAELRLALVRDGRPASETWLMRWQG